MTSFRLPVERLQGSHYSIATEFAEGYAHWILDALPRLFALEDCGVETRLIVNSVDTKWKAESLALLGVDEERVVELGSRALEVDFLVMPSYVGDPGNPHPFGCRWLRERLNPRLGEATGSRRIYISRRRARRRRIVNETEIAAALEEAGFETIEAESLSFADQVQTFADASVVVAPHGAGLANIIFAPERCRVLEIFDPLHVNVMYYALADTLGQRYGYVVGDPAQPSDPRHGISGHDDLYVSVERVRRALDSLLAV